MATTISAPRRRGRQVLSALLLGTSLAGAALPVFAPAAATAQESVQIDIPPMPLASALSRLGDQTGLQLAFSPAAVSGRAAPAVSGTMSPASALNRLLSGSGLRATFVGARTVSITGGPAAEAPTEGSGDGILLAPIIVSAEEQIKQAPGVSTITSEDLARQPPARDVTEAIRRMPGVNLTGNTTSGSRGNQRQIDIRGMGPENTLILIDGKPVLSRNSVRYSMSGERDSRGDASWVLPEEIESIEVIRGPAAARYGSGASGGVVNIITTQPENPTYSLSTFFSEPESRLEGSSRRMSFSAAAPITDRLAYRLSFGRSTTEADAPNINGDLAEDGAGSAPAGREGLRSVDARAMLSWEPNDRNRFKFELGHSRQRNIYAGDVYFSDYAPSAAIVALAGTETNRMTRNTYSLSHLGSYGFGDWENILQLERTKNHRLAEGLAGNGEGTIVTNPETAGWTDSYLDNIFAKSELRMPVEFLVPQVVTIGAEYRAETAKDEGTIQRSGALDPEFGIPIAPEGANRDATLKGWNAAVYAESNMLIGDTLTLTPGLRVDYDKNFGANLSPSLNASWEVTDQITLKAGIARAFKAPNAYQLHEGYVYSSRGGGCYDLENVMRGPCNIIGNPDLDPERSVNTEFGINYHNDADWNLGATWFHNDYDNRIISGGDPVGVINDPEGNPTRYLFRWRNSGPAKVTGIEGNLSIPFGDSVVWTANYTRMLESKLDSGQQISLIPDHTLNTSIDWQATDQLALTLSATHYGKIKPLRDSYDEDDPASARPAYWLANVTVNYDINDTTALVAGVNNIFDETLKRTGKGANTFNEAGRSMFVGLTARW